MMLSPVKTIDIPLWMKSREVKRLMTVLAGYGDSPSTLFVGGSVRNLLLEKEVCDVDLATQFTPEEVLEKLKHAGIRAIPTGLKHGTVTAVIEEKSYEITSLRCDMKTDGRHADVSFTKDWLEDSRRRDFTMNTLLAAMDGRLFDPTGRGLADLHNRKVVFVGKPEKRIEEDYLRILRFFRFHTLYGAGEVDEEVLTVCQKYAGRLKRLSKERVSQEFFKILSVDDPVDTLNIMRNNNILEEIVATDYSAQALKTLCRLQQHYNMFSLVARLLVLCGLDDSRFAALDECFVLTNKMRAKGRQMLSIISSLKFVEENDVKALIYKYKKDIATQCLFLFYGGDTQELGEAMSIITSSWSPPPFPVNGMDLMALGFSAGPGLGQRLQDVETWWITGGFAADKDACLAFASGQS